MKEKVPYRKGGVQTEKSSPSDRRVGFAYVCLFVLGSKLKASTIPGWRIST